jgi:hypothetical protein
MDFLRKNWIVLAVALVIFMVLMNRRKLAAATGLAAPTGTDVPGTEEPRSASDGLTHPEGATAGPTLASRKGRGHF